jgi:16S rRNA processing protein RimM
MQKSWWFGPLSSIQPTGNFKEDQYYYHELIGFEVIDESLGNIGEVKVIYDLETQDLLGVDHKGKEVLIPIQDQIIQKVDKAEKKFTATCPKDCLKYTWKTDAH